MSLLETIEENPIQDPGKQLTAAFFIILCLGKAFKMYQHLTNSTILSLIKMIVLYPEPETNSCRDYDFLKSCLHGETQRYIYIYAPACIQP